jgi:uncharacterized membrane protein (DUF2068 family)
MINDKKFLLGLKVIAFLKTLRGFGALLFAYSLYFSIDSSSIGSVLAANPHGDNSVLASLLLSASDLLASFDKASVVGLIAVALVYAVIRFLEAAGIFLDKTWAECLAMITGLANLVVIGRLIYLQNSVVLASIFVVNVAVLIYLAVVLLRKRKRH